MSDETGLDLGIEGITNALHIGSGGAADVYRAEQPRLGRTVAVKVLRANTSDENRARFEREAQTLGRLSNHPGIVTLHEAGLTAIGQPFLMMEFCPAGTLADRTAAQGPIAWQEACEIVAEIAEVVDDAHESGVLHRDLKPANVLIDSRGKHLVADFGVAALSDTGNYSAAADFTPGYAPPETLRGDAATPAGDVYSLAATVHALITGRVPFEAADTSNNNVLAWIRRIETEAPEDLRPIGVPDDVVCVIETAMSKEPTDRPPAAVFSQQLAAASEGVIVNGSAQPNTGDPMTTAVAAVLPQKPTSNQPPMPAAAPPMPGVPAAAPPMPTGEIAQPAPAPAADAGHTTAVPQLLPQKPTSREVPGALGAMPPMPGGANIGPVPPVPGQQGPSTAQVPPIPGDPTTGQVPPTADVLDPSTGPVPTPSDPVTGPAAFGAVATPIPATPVTPAPEPPTAAAPAAPVMPTSPIAPVGPTTGPDPLGPPPGSPTTSPVPAISDLQLPAEPATAPVPVVGPGFTDGQPATTAVPGVLPTGPTTIDRPVLTEEDEGGSKKGLFVGVGVGAVALLGGGALLLNSLGGGETAATTMASTSTTIEETTTTGSTTTTTEPTTTTALVVAVVGDAEATITSTSIVLSGMVPDKATAEAIRAAAGNFYSRDQITDELKVDSSVNEVKLTLVGELADEERIEELETAFEDVDDVEVVSSIEVVTTTAATSPPRTNPPRTNPPRTNPPATTQPTTPPPPVETGNTNPGLG